MRPGTTLNSTNTITFDGHKIPFRDDPHLHLWGSTFPTPANTRVVICTDGSTSPGHPSGASLVFLTDTFLENEFEPRHIKWRIPQSDNYLAEVSAILQSLYTVPVTTPLTIHTDSESAILAIKSQLNRPDTASTLRCAARPYIKAICNAILRRAESAPHTPTRTPHTSIIHVSSNTGKRDLPSIGNEAADSKAKEATQLPSTTRFYPEDLLHH